MLLLVLLGALLLGGAIGIGFLLRRLLPAVEIGTAFLIGLLVILLAFKAMSWVMDTLSFLAEFSPDDEAEDDASAAAQASAVYSRGSARRTRRRDRTGKREAVRPAT